MQDASARRQKPNFALFPATLAESFRRRLGTLDPQQVAIWRRMTPAKKDPPGLSNV